MSSSNSWQPPSDGASVPSPDSALSKDGTESPSTAPSDPSFSATTLAGQSGQATDPTSATPRFGNYGPGVYPAGTPSPANTATTHAPEPEYATGAYGVGSPGSEAPGISPAPAPPTFSVAPKPGIIPLRPLSVSEILSGAFEALRANPRAMFVPALLVMSIIGLFHAALSYALEPNPLMRLDSLATTSETDTISSADLGLTMASSLTAAGIEAILVVLSQAVLTGLLIVAVSRAVLGRIASPSEVWNRVRPRVGALIGQSILISLINAVVAAIVLAVVAIVVAALLFGVAGTSDSTGAIVVGVLAILVVIILGVITVAFLWVRFSLAPAALILENVSMTQGMRRSWRLTRGSFWRVLGILLLNGLIVGAVSTLITGAIAIVPTVLAFVLSGTAGLVTAITSFLAMFANAIVMPFSSAIYALTYIDLRMRREGLDVELRRSTAPTE